MVAPASYAQQSLWLIQQLDPGDTAHSLSRALVLKGELDRAAMAQAVIGLTNRHAALRTTFREKEGQLAQVVHREWHGSIEDVDLRGDARGADGDARARCIRDLATQPFDLAAGPLWRVTLIRVAADEHVLLLGAHHIIVDGGSLVVLTRDLGALYSAIVRGQAPSLPALAGDFAGHSTRQRAWLATPAAEDSLRYWTEALAGAPGTALPAIERRRAGEPVRPRTIRVELGLDVSSALRTVARRAEVSTFTVLLTAFKCLVMRCTGQSDLVIGVPVSGREPGMENVVGMFTNRVAIRTKLGGDPTFLEALARARAALRGAYDHQSLPFDLLLARRRPNRAGDVHPWYQVLFNALPWVRGEPDPEFAGLKADIWLPAIFDPDAALDAGIYVQRTEGAFALDCIYDASRFDPASVQDFLGDYGRLLEAAAAAPEWRCSALLPVVERDAERAGREAQRKMIETPRSFETVAASASDKSLFDRFAASARRHPGRLAITSSTCTWSYGQVESRARAIAEALQRGPGSGPCCIALLLAHDADAIAAMFGVLAGGNAYVPLGLAWPEARMRQVVEDANAAAIVTDAAHAATANRLAGPGRVVIDVSALRQPKGPEVSVGGAAPDSLAYILYTSGSTGRPKGVAQTQRNVSGHIRAYTNALRICPDDRLALVASLATDAAVMDVFGALLNGASLHLFDLQSLGAEPVGEWMRDRGVTIYHSTPTAYRRVLETDAQGQWPSMRVVVLGGEAARHSDFARFQQRFRPECRLVNGLGPTESTLALQCVLQRSSAIAGDTVPAGYAVDDVRVLLLDETGGPDEVLSRGEIAIRGDHLALGYWRQPAATARVFVPDPIGGGRRMYRTGDRGRRLPDGRIEFAGRLDRQIKIRGNRVEPGEVEAALAAEPDIREAVVTSWSDAGEPRLAAYFMARPNASVDPAALRRTLAARLPAHMIPTDLIEVPELPITTSGKLDRGALPAPRRPATSEFVAPRNEIEAALSRIWCDLLGRPSVSVDDDFFALGGHSLLAAALVARMRRDLRVDLTLRTIFDFPTVAALSGKVVSRIARTVDDDALLALLADLEMMDAAHE